MAWLRSQRRGFNLISNRTSRVCLTWGKLKLLIPYPRQNSPTVSAMPMMTTNTRSAFSLTTLSIFAPA
jgi:hypothetical protein